MDNDPDETEGRKLYRARANSLATAQIAIGKRKVEMTDNQGWRCFYCNELFTDRALAESHFGVRYADDPTCIPDKITAQAWANRVERAQAETERQRGITQEWIDEYVKLRDDAPAPRSPQENA